MNTLEDKVRLALRETGEEIGPHTVPPLRLRGRRGGGRLPRIPGRWGTWVTPLAAAAAVAAVIAGSLAISATFRGHAHPPGHGSGPGPAAPSHGSPIGPASALRLVPPYFAVLAGPTRSAGDYRAVIRSTVTGRTLATVTPPRPYRVFTWVSGAADDRTFVLAAQRYWYIASGQAGMPAENRDNTTPTVFFKLTFDPHARSAQLTRLSVPGTTHSSDLAGMAVSPDGSRLALDLRKSIEVVTLATGATRTWTWPGAGWAGNWKPLGQIFSWSADGRYLSFQQWGGEIENMHVRVLDTAAPGTSLSMARVVVTFPNSGGGALDTSDTFLTPDGTRIVTADTYTGYGQVTEYSVRTGSPVRHEDRFSGPVGWQEVLWTGPHGNALVVSDPRGKKNSYGQHNNILGVLAGNRFTPIPHGADEFISLAW